ncbi:hypothetical protein [Litoribacter populi]|uniref:hypothetical protein n=1 Tax=Litoribacter populi TaxID=2598460 RepID=UPI00117FB65D|nr:hypothetical protein [Litoribacter populi]
MKVPKFILPLFIVSTGVAFAHDPVEHNSPKASYFDFPWRDLDAFPSSHPLIVHFVIVLLIVGAILYGINIYFRKLSLYWTALVMYIFGLGAAYLASYPLHPHTAGLTEAAQEIMYLHDFWAYNTLTIGTIGAVLMIGNLFLFRRNRIAMTAVALVLLLTSYAVSMAGHYGAHLVHIEGVGPKGEFLEKHEH